MTEKELKQLDKANRMINYYRCSFIGSYIWIKKPELLKKWIKIKKKLEAILAD